MQDIDPSRLVATRLMACAARRLGPSFQRGDITRIWVLDLGWFSISEAEVIVQNLIDSRYLLLDRDGNLRSAIDLSDVSAPLGWVPSPSEAMKIVSLEVNGSEPAPTLSIIEEEQPAPAATPPSSTANTGRLLIEMIANASGLEKGEIARRSTRKRRALSLVAPWCSLLLLASELGLDLSPFYGELVSSGVLTS